MNAYLVTIDFNVFADSIEKIRNEMENWLTQTLDLEKGTDFSVKYIETLYEVKEDDDQKVHAH